MSSHETKQKSSWIKIFPFVIGTYFLVLSYNYNYLGGLTIKTFSESLAATGGIFIGLSLLMSSISYFFDFADGYLRYRKEFGIYGFIFALFYCFSLQYTNPEKYFYGLKDNLSDPEVILGLVAMTVLTFMASISNRHGMKLLGPKLWRHALRLGYLVFLLLVARAVILEGSSWVLWFENIDITKTPPRLALTVFALFTVFSRVALEFSLRRKKS